MPAHELTRLLAGLSLLAACSDRDQLPPGPESADENLALHAEFADRVTRFGLADSWGELSGRHGENDPRKPIGLRPMLDLRDGEIAALGAHLSDPRDRRTLEIVADASLRTQLNADDGIRSALADYDSVRLRHLPPLAPRLERVLTESAVAAERRAAWLELNGGSVEIGTALRQLIRVRNAWAQRFGPESFLDRLASHSGLDPASLASLRAELEAALRPPDDAIPVDPWDVEAADPALMGRLSTVLDESGCIDRGRTALVWAGLPSAPPNLWLVQQPATTVFASYATFAVAPPDDVRAIVTPGAGMLAHWSTLHEFGHVAQALVAPSDEPPLSRRVWANAVAESVAKVTERLAYAPEWLRTQGVQEPDVQALLSWERRSERSRMRWTLAHLRFETTLYDAPDTDLDLVHAELWRKIGGLRPIAGLSAWAIDRNFGYWPGRRSDGLVGRCAQAAIYRRLRALPGGLLGPAASELLRTEVIAGSQRLTYDEWFRRAAGTSPSCRAWLEDVAGVSEVER